MDPFGDMCNFNGGNQHQQQPSAGTAVSAGATPETSVKPAGSPTTPNDPEQQVEKTDCSPENSKKSDSSPEGDDAFRGSGATPTASSEATTGSVSKSVSLHEMLKNGGGAGGPGGGGRSVSEEPTRATKGDQALLAESVRNAFVFTIDFGDSRKPVDLQRHEKMLERFQARHKRGVSLSKLESSSTATSAGTRASPAGLVRAPASANLPRRNKNVASGMESQSQPAQQQQQQQQQLVMIDDATGRPVAVKLREKNQRTVGGRGDSATNKRHSWSPRTSMSEASAGGRPQEPGTPKPANKTTGSARFAPKSATLALALEQRQQVMAAGGKDAVYSSSEFNAESLDSTGGIPCLEAPLENFRPSRGGGDDDDDDNVSETGTYTIDGANYTEEQKERMNIDRVGSPFGGALPPEVIDPVPVAVIPATTATAVRPTGFREELEVIDLERTASSQYVGARKVTPGSGKQQPEEKPVEPRKHNILEVSYFHEPTAVVGADKGVPMERAKSKQSYIEKLKSRMKNIAHKTSAGVGGQQQQLAASADKVLLAELESPDQGTFTSVTTSGILSLKPVLPEDSVATQRRRGSLTKAHIDSSEYVQGVAKLNIHSGVSSSVVAELSGADPDHNADEEELKILNCCTDSEKAHQGGHHRAGKARAETASPELVGSGRRKHHQPSDVAALTSVATKKDWIQEWAKNAREYSKSTSPKVHPHEPPPATTAYAPAPSSTTPSGPMTRSFGDYGDGERNPRSSRANQFGYDFDIDLTKNDYYEAKKYEEFGDNLDHRQQQQQQHYRAGGRNHQSHDPLTFRQQHQQHPLTTTSPQDEMYALPYGMNEFARTASRGSTRRYGQQQQQQQQHPSPVSAAAKPPMSPSKIPSPIGSIGRARSVSRNRSLQGSNSDLSGNETEMYLQKTAAAISTLQNLQRRNSLRNSSSHHSSSPHSPASRKLSPKVSPMNSLHSPIHSPSGMYHEKAFNSSYGGDVSGSPLYSPQHLQRGNLQHHQLHQNTGGHKRNHSLDSGAPDPLTHHYLANGAGHMAKGANNSTSPKLDFPKRHHTRHNSYEGVMASLPPKPVKCFQQFDPAGAAPTGGYYGAAHELMVGGDDVDVDVVGDGQDYDEDFEDDIDDDEDDERELDQQELHRRAAGLVDITATLNEHAMPRPRAMSLGLRRTTGTASSQAHQQHQQQQHHSQSSSSSTGAKQPIAAAVKNVTNRVQKTHSAGSGHHQQQQQQHLTSPIKRSSSFSVKPSVMKPATPTLSANRATGGANGRTVGGGPKIQKSASSTSFKKMIGAMDNGVQPQQYHHHAVQPPHHRHQLVMDPNYPDELMLYINDGDDDGLQMHGAAERRHQQQGYSSSSLTDEDEDGGGGELEDEDPDDDESGRLEKEPLTNTRYNKTFLMRMEQNKKIASGVAAAGGTGGTKQSGGAAACPNTPELPRRSVQVRGLGRDRASMPRDSSLNRMKQDLALRKTSTGRESLLGKGQQQSTQSIQSAVSSTGGGGGKVQPKYLDISKYKSSNAANFLKKDESKSYLIRQEGVRKSPSSASVSSALSRTDPTRMSARSIKSASSAASKSSGTGATGGGNKKDPVKVAKEQELEMWRRRASYDPMKAAMEGKKKQQEESRRLAAQQQQQQQQQQHSERQSKSVESSVLRSQSYHSGVANIGGNQHRLYQGTVGNCSNVNLRGVYNQSGGLPSDDGDSTNRWTLTSTESSEDLEGDLHYIN